MTTKRSINDPNVQRSTGRESYWVQIPASQCEYDDWCTGTRMRALPSADDQARKMR